MPAQGRWLLFSSSFCLHFPTISAGVFLFTQSWIMKSILFFQGFFLLAIVSYGQTVINKDSSALTLFPDSVRIKTAGLFLDPVEIRAIRAGDKTPFTQVTINAAQISKINNGQDLPYILNQTPSVVTSSDAGNGFGYTGISIRGTDASRINMTLNGLPYNDAESQAIYFVDLPDFASSTSSVQIQRGVGTSSNGAGAFGASMNFSTNEFLLAAYAEFNNSFGSFNSWKNTLKAGSGLIGGHFTVDMRLSHISSNGFIDRATSDLKSAYFSAAYISDKTSLRFNIITGSEKTYQAWNGVPGAKLFGDSAQLQQEYLDNSGYPGALYNTPADSVNLFTSNRRTYNYFTYANQTDNYRQDHYQLFFNREITPMLSGNLAAFMTHGKGYYEEYENDASYSDYGLADPKYGDTILSSTNLIRQRWLDNYFYGGIYSLQFKNNQTSLTLGGGWTEYNGQHYGTVIWSAEGGVPPDYEYYNVPAKKTDFNIYGKWQQQIANWFTSFADLQWRQVNYWINDFELGLNKKTPLFNWGITGYYMLYRNELVLTGKINDVGEYTRTNTPRSWRLGIELQGSIKPAGWIQVSGNLTLSQNKILNYTSYEDDYDNGGQVSTIYPKTDMALSPGLIGAAIISFYPLPVLEISLPAKYVGSAFLDNTQSSNKKLSDYYVQQLRIIYSPRIKYTREIDRK